MILDDNVGLAHLHHNNVENDTHLDVLQNIIEENDIRPVATRTSTGKFIWKLVSMKLRLKTRIMQTASSTLSNNFILRLYLVSAKPICSFYSTRGHGREDIHKISKKRDVQILYSN